MADALASGASVRKDVGVQVPPSAPCKDDYFDIMGIKAIVLIFDMFPFDINLDIYDVLAYREKLPIYCQENDEPIFVATDKGKDIVFMSIILYNFLAGNPPEYEDDKLEFPPKRKAKRSKAANSKASAKIYPFVDMSKHHKAKN